MSLEENPDTSQFQNPNVSREHSDVSIRGILVFGIGLLICAVVVHLLIWFLMVFFEQREIAKEPRMPSMASGRQHLPPEPRLQLAPGHDVHPEVEMRMLRDREKAALDSYGWIDPAAGMVRIPIERAKELLAKRAAVENGRR